jgi:hypothetical protein
MTEAARSPNCALIDKSHGAPGTGSARLNFTAIPEHLSGAPFRFSGFIWAWDFFFPVT